MEGDAEPSASYPPRKRDDVEIMLRIAGRRVYAIHAFGDWLYFNGSVGGTGTRRIPKNAFDLSDPDGDPVCPWTGSTLGVFHSDATHVYWLDKTIVYRQGLEGEPQVVAELDESYDFLTGDDDTVVAIYDSCVRVLLMDKATLSTRVIEPEGQGPHGGSVATASDGRTFLCAARRSLVPVAQTTGDLGVVVHQVDKASGSVVSTDIEGTGTDNPGGGPAVSSQPATGQIRPDRGQIVQDPGPNRRSSLGLRFAASRQTGGVPRPIREGWGRQDPAHKMAPRHL